MNFNTAEFKTSYGNTSKMPPSDRFELAFSGRSNVGKSSLINKIFNRKALARVSSMPGKTVTINFYSIENIHIVDLPGYGYAKISKHEKNTWGNLIGGYLNDERRELALVFQLVDMRHAPTKDDIMMINFLIDNEIPFVIVFTKCDKLKTNERKKRLEGFAQEIPCFDHITSVAFSALTGEGVDEIRGIIEEIAADSVVHEPEETESEETEEDEDYPDYYDEDDDDEYEDIPENNDDENGFSGFLRPNRK